MRKPQQVRFHSWNKHKPPSPVKKNPRSPGELKATSPARSPAPKKSRVDENKDDSLHDTLEVEANESESVLDHSSHRGNKIFEHDDDEEPVGTYASMLRYPKVARADTSTKEPSSLSSSFAADFFGTEKSRKYFQAEHKERDMGKREIVAKSQFGFTSMASALVARDVNYATEVAHFTHNLSRGQREHFAKVLKMTVKKVVHDRKVLGQPDRPWKSFIPTTYLDIRKHYTGYPDSFLNQLPIPSVLPLGKSFACIRLRDCVQNFLAFGFPLSTIPKPPSSDGRVSSIIESAYCRRRLEEIEKLYPSGNVLVLWILEWSDGYDPHGFAKSNRGSAWIKIVTFVAPPKYGNSVMYTYPVALGSVSANHDLVEEWFRDDLQQLSNPKATNRFYSGSHKDFVRVHVELVASLMDQPERRGAVHLTRGNSIFGRRWGYTVQLEKCKDKLVPCGACSCRLLAGDKTWDSTSCPDCAQWDMDRPDNAAKLRCVCPENYPASELPSDGLLLPTKLTFPMLKRALQKASTLLSEGAWTKTNVQVYLSTLCINKNMIKHVVSNAENILLLNEADRQRVEKPDEYQQIMEIFAENQDDFSEVKPPLFGTEACPFINTLMSSCTCYSWVPLMEPCSLSTSG
jgi:hypothetical protein